jgi:hypothetical protein
MTTKDDRPAPDAVEPNAVKPGATAPPGAAESTAATPSGAAAAADTPKGRVIRRDGSSPTPTAPADPPRAMIPARGVRPRIEAVLMRVIATAGIVGISVAIAAIMGTQHSKAWLIGLVTSIVSVVLAAVLWSSRRL